MIRSVLSLTALLSSLALDPTMEDALANFQTSDL